MVSDTRYAEDLLDELRNYDNQKQQEAMIETLTKYEIELLQGQNLTPDERKLILDIVEPLPTRDLL